MISDPSLTPRDDAEPVELAFRLALDVLQPLLVEELAVGIEGGEHAAQRRVGQRLVADFIAVDVVLADELDHPGEEKRVLVALVEIGGGGGKPALHPQDAVEEQDGRQQDGEPGAAGHLGLSLTVERNRAEEKGDRALVAADHRAAVPFALMERLRLRRPAVGGYLNGWLLNESWLSGRRKMMVVPFPTSLSICTTPPWACIMCFTMERPRRSRPRRGCGPCRPGKSARKYGADRPGECRCRCRPPAPPFRSPGAGRR